MSKYKVRRDRLIEFVNFYEPVWYELCYEYHLGYLSEANAITASEVKLLDIYAIVEDIDNKKYLTTYVGSDNDAIVYENFIEENEEYNTDTIMGFFEKIIE
jgi:hypothetical protein